LLNSEGLAMDSHNFIEKSLNGRSYWEALNGEVVADSPIVITMHWWTGTATVMNFLFNGMTTPARMICLQGLYPSGHEAGGHSWFPYGAKFYDEMSEAEQAPIIREEAAKIADFISALKQEHPGKIIVTGMSQGGDLSLCLAVYHSPLIDIAIPCAGRLSPVMRPETPLKPSSQIRMQQGIDDKIVSLESARETRDWLKSTGFDVILDEYADLGHDISAAMVKRIQEIIA
jgi:predicted esterase